MFDLSNQNNQFVCAPRRTNDISLEQIYQHISEIEKITSWTAAPHTDTQTDGCRNNTSLTAVEHVNK